MCVVYESSKALFGVGTYNKCDPSHPITNIYFQ